MLPSFIPPEGATLWLLAFVGFYYPASLPTSDNFFLPRTIHLPLLFLIVSSTPPCTPPSPPPHREEEIVGARPITLGDWMRRVSSRMTSTPQAGQTQEPGSSRVAQASAMSGSYPRCDTRSSSDSKGRKEGGRRLGVRVVLTRSSRHLTVCRGLSIRHCRHSTVLQGTCCCRRCKG